MIEFVDACLRGAAQVLLQNNPLTGLLILVGIAWAAVDNGHPRVIVGALVGAGRRHGDRDPAAGRRAPSLRKGLFGFSPLLTGIGVTDFLDTGR